MHLTSQQATEHYKVSLRTLRTLIAGLTAEQRQKHLIIKGKQYLISTELLNQHYQARPGEQVQNESASVQNESAKVQNESAKVQNESAKVQNESAKVQNESAKKVQNDVVKVQTELITHLQNENTQLHQRLQESTYIIANLTKNIAPPAAPTTKANDGFFWFIVGLVLGFTCLGFVIWFNS